jgi:selenocysteine lyase/cysteine desulfurase
MRIISRERARIDPVVAALRSRDFSRLDARRHSYLDYTGSALYAERQLLAHHALLADRLLGNPHSDSDTSKASTQVLEEARRAVLRFLDADEADYAVCFTANASAAIKLVAESYPFSPDGALVLTADNHNSVNGVREFARRRGAAVGYVALDGSLRLCEAKEALIAVPARARSTGARERRGRRLFAYPAQSNFSGVQHPLALVATAKALGYDVLLDVAAYVPTHRLSLRDVAADFVALSFYKVFGYPTGVGALVARREALAALERPWFAGGTVEYVSVQNDTHRLRTGCEGFEDGTPDFLGIAALRAGFALVDEIGMDRIGRHAMMLVDALLEGVRALTHANGRPVVRLYGPADLIDRGATVAFNLQDDAGRIIPFMRVEERARAEGVSLRGGCFCNPGASEAAFGFPAAIAASCLHLSATAGFSPEWFAACLGGGYPVGAVRASLGLANNLEDVDRAIAVLAAFKS